MTSLPSNLAPPLLIFGSLLALAAGRKVLLGRESTKWPSASGRVLASSVHINFFGFGQFRVEVHYRYVVDSESHESRRLGHRIFATRRAAELAAYHYPPGNQVQVFYDPKRPQEAVLEHGAGILPQLALGLAILALVVGLTVLLAGTPR